MTNQNPQASTGGEPPSIHHLEAQRRANRDAVAALGLSPYGHSTTGLVSCAAARAMYSERADAAFNAAGKEKPAGFVDPRPLAKVAGRVVLHRDNGKLVWISLRDESGDVQVAVSQRDCDEKAFQVAKLTDLGDVLVARGRVMKTKTGEVTIWADLIEPATKCLVPPPDKHSGLADIEMRYRQRYLDMWVNPETVRVFRLRSRIVSSARSLLAGRGFIEVETPMLQSLAGGAAARPFVTHMNALDMSLFMRIAPELYLKRLLVGGMPKVFEVNRNFRNEGLDKQHNPEFTMLEAYEAFGDVESVMELTESIVREAAKAVAADPDYHALLAAMRGSTPAEEAAKVKGLHLPFGDLTIDFASPFRRQSYAELFEKAWGFSMVEGGKAKDELIKRRPGQAKAIAAMDDILAVNELFEDKERGGEAQLDHSRPTFITDYPAAISPLTRPKQSNPVLADRADLFIAGMELAPHYTELNDPDVQEAKFKEQLKGLDAEKNAEENTFRTMDHDFLRALRVGMPPAGGMGVGIDRLVMLLTNQRTIRDVVLFPLMRPE
jgi:lysyl-tRNA synthetase, class II